MVRMYEAVPKKNRKDRQEAWAKFEPRTYHDGRKRFIWYAVVARLSARIVAVIFEVVVSGVVASSVANEVEC